MKRIINNKCYNTETAELIAEYWNGVSNEDFRYVYEKLYHRIYFELKQQIVPTDVGVGDGEGEFRNIMVFAVLVQEGAVGHVFEIGDSTEKIMPAHAA